MIDLADGDVIVGVAVMDGVESAASDGASLDGASADGDGAAAEL